MKKQTHKGIGEIWGKRTGYVQAEEEYLGWFLRPMCIPQGYVSGSNALYWDGHRARFLWQGAGDKMLLFGQ